MNSPGVLQRYRRSTARRPALWSTLRRALGVGAALAGMTLAVRGARGRALRAHQRALEWSAVSRELRRLVPTEAVLRRRGTYTRAVRKALRLSRARRRALQRLRTIRGVLAGLGIGYVGMPLARQSGQRRNLAWQQREVRPVTVITR
jgi:hypothetical protein